ncbi:MAG: hypothetical protein WKG07_21255 [Hymenobacter sp.]
MGRSRPPLPPVPVDAPVPAGMLVPAIDSAAAPVAAPSTTPAITTAPRPQWR